jgi:hypothetical protein
MCVIDGKLKTRPRIAFVILMGHGFEIHAQYNFSCEAGRGTKLEALAPGLSFIGVAEGEKEDLEG